MKNEKKKFSRIVMVFLSVFVIGMVVIGIYFGNVLVDNDKENNDSNSNDTIGLNELVSDIDSKDNRSEDLEDEGNKIPSEEPQDKLEDKPAEKSDTNQINGTCNQDNNSTNNKDNIEKEEPDNGNNNPETPDNGTTDEPKDNSTDVPDNNTNEEPVNEEPDQPDNNETVENNDTSENNSTEDDKNTKPVLMGEISIDGIGKFKFESEKVQTVRKDIFKPGYFSLFDILVHIDNNGDIDLKYHFDKSKNTNVIDSIDSIENWWYYAYYDGGWSESNAFRMDHYPYKDNTTIVVHQEDESTIEKIYDAFESEVERREKNGGKVIIPKVIINGPTTHREFEDVEVFAHNLRSDSFQEGVITAIDVIMSLGDQEKITYKLNWMEQVGTADPIKDYWVHRINNDEAYGYCGWVYEEGTTVMGGRNHIHIPSDQRVLNSPDYEEWFWICL